MYEAQPQSFKNPLFGTKGSPSPQLLTYTAHTESNKISLESPACVSIARDHVPGQNNVMTPVANLSDDINAAADEQKLAQGMSAVKLSGARKLHDFDS